MATRPFVTPLYRNRREYANPNAEGHLAGIEILDAVKRFGRQDVTRQVVLGDAALVRAG